MNPRTLSLLAAFVLASGCSKSSSDGPPAGPSAAPPPVPVATAAPTPSASASGGTGTGGGGGNGGGANAANGAPPLKVVVTGAAPAEWSADTLAAVKSFTVNTDGTNKDAWSLRDAAHQLVGPKARVTGAVDSDGSRTAIAPKDWKDAKKVPVLRVNRRGKYKIEWVDKDGIGTNDPDVRDVKTIEITPAG